MNQKGRPNGCCQWYLRSENDSPRLPRFLENTDGHSRVRLQPMPGGPNLRARGLGAMAALWRRLGAGAQPSGRLAQSSEAMPEVCGELCLFAFNSIIERFRIPIV